MSSSTPEPNHVMQDQDLEGSGVDGSTIGLARNGKAAPKSSMEAEGSQHFSGDDSPW